MTHESEQARSSRLNRISKLACIMKWISTGCIAVIVVLSVGIALALIFPGFDHFAIETSVELEEFERSYADLPFGQRMGFLALLAASAGVLLTLLWNLRLVFELFETYQFFGKRTLSKVLVLGGSLIFFGLFDIASDPIASYLLTLDLPEEQQLTEIIIEGGELFFLVFGSLMLVFGWIMREAAVIDEENRQFI